MGKSGGGGGGGEEKVGGMGWRWGEGEGGWSGGASTYFPWGRDSV